MLADSFRCLRLDIMWIHHGRYHPVLLLPAQSTLNYNQSVMNVQGMYIGTTGLESTCLVLATGIDMYLTQAAPSKKFDQLNADFPHALVVVSLVALTVGIFFARSKSHDKILSNLWR